MRVSLGATSRYADVEAVVAFFERFFSEPDTAPARTVLPGQEGALTLGKLTLYPVKSCAGQQVETGEWRLEETGLAYDRQWLVVDAHTGGALSQKRHPRMVLIRPRVCLRTCTLTLSAPGQQDLGLPLDQVDELDEARAKMCGESVAVVHVDDAADAWLSRFLGVACELRRHTGDSARHSEGGAAPLLLSNESPFLLISSSSTGQVNEWIAQRGEHAPVPSACFRANIELDGSTPFSEDEIDLLRIGDEIFQTLGACRRCLMVSINQVCPLHRHDTLDG